MVQQSEDSFRERVVRVPLPEAGEKGRKVFFCKAGRALLLAEAIESLYNLVELSRTPEIQQGVDVEAVIVDCVATDVLMGEVLFFYGRDMQPPISNKL